MSQLGLQPLSGLSLQGNLSENWKSWIRRYELYCIASGIDKKTELVQCATFLRVAGEAAIKVSNTFVCEEGVKDETAARKRKFQEQCEPFVYAHTRTVRDVYVTDLTSIAKNIVNLEFA